MKICYTENEVQEILLEHVRTKFNIEVNFVRMDRYRDDFCVIKYVEPEAEVPNIRVTSIRGQNEGAN